MKLFLVVLLIFVILILVNQIKKYQILKIDFESMTSEKEYWRNEYFNLRKKFDRRREERLGITQKPRFRKVRY